MGGLLKVSKAVFALTVAFGLAPMPCADAMETAEIAENGVIGETAIAEAASAAWRQETAAPADGDQGAEGAPAVLSYDRDSSASSRQKDASLRSGAIQSGDWAYFENEDGTVMVSGYSGAETDVAMPAAIDGKTVTSVRFENPSYCSIRSLALPSTLETIGGYAFEGMASLESVTFPEGSRLKTIGSEAFAYTGLRQFTMPDSLETVYALAFLGCHELEYLQFNEGLEPLSSDQSIVSGSDVFEYTAFYALAPFADKVEFRVPAASEHFKAEDGVLFSKDGSVLYERPYGATETAYAVPESVKAIAQYAFYGQESLTAIDLPDGLETIHDCAFSRSGIASLTIPDSVTTVYGSVCYECRSLERVVVGNGLKELGSAAGWNDFYGCSKLSDVVLGESLEVIGNACFAGTSLVEIDIPASVRQINYGAFGDIPSLTAVTGAEGLERVNNLAFRNASLVHFPFGDNVRYVSGTAFQGCASFDGQYPAYLERTASGAYVRYDAHLVLEGTDVYSYAYQVLEQVNEERAANGLAALTMDQELLEAAMQRAAEVAVFFSHTRPDGDSCSAISEKAWGENIAAGQWSPEQVMDSWMNSSGHRSNILGESWRSVGIGCFRTADGTYEWVQLFGPDAAEAAAQREDVASARTVAVVQDECGVQLAVNALGAGFDVWGDWAMAPLGTAGRARIEAVNTGFSPVTVSNEGASWSSSRPQVAVVDGDGQVSMVGEGGTKLTASIGSMAASAFVATAVNPGVFFQDVPWSHWAYDYVHAAGAAGYVNGVGAGLFAPEQTVSRGQVVTILWRAAGEPQASAPAGFADVAADAYYAQAVAWAVEAGFVNGVDATRFDPDGGVSREACAKMIAGFARFQGVDTSHADQSALRNCVDWEQASSWALDDLAWTASAGILGGSLEDGVLRLNPQGTALRSQMAKMTMTSLESVL